MIAALASLALTLSAGPAAAARPAPPSFQSGDGLQVTSAQRLDKRLYELTVTTPSLPGPAAIRILLPASYESEPRRRYPVLYLFHGTSGGAADWTEKGEAEQTTEGLPLIVVMPDIGLDDDGGGYCTNWVSGAYSWETFHIDQLIPWVGANLRTIASRAGRAIAGLSQGGFCSLSYAARHPDLFQTALAYSGVPDIAWNADDTVGFTAVAYATEVGLDGEPPNSMFGSRAGEEINWADHDPTTLAENLRGMNLFEYFGNGVPESGETPEPGAMSIEALVHEDNIHFHERLTELGIPSVYDPYGNGTHSWPYWARDLRWSIGPTMEELAHPGPAPAKVTYTIADPEYSVFGWTVTMHRTAEEFSTLEEADAHGFELAGSGSGSVVTPPDFRPARGYLVTLRGREGTSSELVTADADGRLHVEVPLGPPNPYQQDTAEALAAGSPVYTTTATIAKARGARPGG
ncbi:MAG TPA: alpha/beta hydrolase family protein [Solirubrobacteraceae bacterium]|nr:alpha/beta hydrolase family protein [Solirubrobacteraceae bacterium]